MTVILLAAGLSSRMGTNKLLLPLGKEPLLLRSLRAALSFSGSVIVVTGHERERIEALLAPFPVQTVYAEDYAKGQGFSMRRGLRAAPDADFAIVPGDLPLLTLEDYLRTSQALSSSSIARPCHGGEPGHPVMFRKEHRERLLAFPGRFKAYVDSSSPCLVEGSIGTVLDADTPERYERLVSLCDDLPLFNREPQGL